MKRAIITGGSGFVGANLARRLLHEGHEVHLLMRRGYNAWRVEALRDHAPLHEVDLGDVEALTRLAATVRPEWIFHLAVHGAYSFQRDARQMVQTNILGTLNLLEACLETGFEAFVNTGSSSEYGFKDHPPGETEWLEPNSSYAVTKASATLFCRSIARSRNVHVPTLRLYSVYGPYEEAQRLVPTLIVHGLKGTLPPLANPDTARDYVYIDDVCNAYLLAAERCPQDHGAVYNVGTGKQTTLREVVEVAQRAMGIPAEPEWGAMQDRDWDTTVWVADSRRIQRELDWRPRADFQDGFRRTVEWFRENEEIVSRQYRRYAGPQTSAAGDRREPRGRRGSEP